MSLSALDIAIIIIGFVLLIVWLVAFFTGLKHASLFDNLDEGEYPLKEIFFVGYQMLELIGYKYQTNRDRKIRQDIEILYEPKYADFYLRLIYAQALTYASTLLVFSFIAYELTHEIAVLIVFIVFSGLAFYYFYTLSAKKIKDRSEEMLLDFSEVVSKLALLTNAGMILKDAWTETAYTGETSIYKEMQQAVVDMENGVAEVDAYYEFGKRCLIPEIKKFTSTIVQGVTKGNKELVYMIQEQSKEVWEARRILIKKKGDSAGNLLMIPMYLMFVGILVMIVVPIFANLGK